MAPHLPELPDLPMAPGQPAAAPTQRPPQPWFMRLREALAAYLPLLLMLWLALGTWWLVKNTPSRPVPREAPAPSSDPDYTMQQFVVERFDRLGRLKLRLEGERLRHFPDTDRFEVDAPRLHAVAADGRVTNARALRAISNGDGSEVQLIGQAEVDSTGPHGEPVEIRGEFLHAFLATERLRSHLPVRVSSEGSEFSADGVEYDHLDGLLRLQGRIRALIQPRVLAPRQDN